MDEIQEIAKMKGGRCLSKEYADPDAKLKWQCAEGHIWEASLPNVKKATWCPICSQGRNERFCRAFFEIIFERKFPKVRPKWLISSRGHRMELDGYCEELRLAFEYQGRQHYEYKHHFYKDSSFDQRKKDDERKRTICKENGIVLIEVPYIVDLEDMHRFIIEECKKRDIDVRNITRAIDHKIFEIYSPHKLKEMQEIANMRQGRCLSEKYIDSQTKLKWQCEKGHTWEAIPNSIKRGTWCPKCGIQKMADAQRSNIEDMQKIARSGGGECLSTSYINNNTRLKWQCKNGHIWEATPGNIKSGKWCPRCIGRGATIEDMRKIAGSKGGKCLSEGYIDSNTNLTWQCEKGHIWQATPANVKRKTWCPFCAAKARGSKQLLTIEEMREIAKKRGGKCLSEKYINANTKLKWQCKKGHRWEAIPSSIKTRTWCPTCSVSKGADARRATIEEMQEIAKSKGGRCLSKTYIDAHTKLKWQCKEGHIWKAIPDSVKRATWCPNCAKNRRKKIF
jgi:hypothetical protein